MIAPSFISYYLYEILIIFQNRNIHSVNPIFYDENMLILGMRKYLITFIQNVNKGFILTRWNLLAITKQHEYYEKRLEELLKEMPDFINEYVEAKMDNRSPLTLFNYVRDYKDFLSWLMADERV